MSANPKDGFEETTELPSGRKKRNVTDELLKVLAESAKRGVAFVKSGTPEAIADLRKDLGSAEVRKMYDMTMETEKVSDTHHKLKFHAQPKPVEPTPSEPAS